MLIRSFNTINFGLNYIHLSLCFESVIFSLNKVLGHIVLSQVWPKELKGTYQIYRQIQISNITPVKVLFNRKVLIFFLFLQENICYGIH